MYPSFVAGFDFGNSDTCMCLSDRGISRSKVISSATAFGSLHDLATKRSGITGDTYERDTDVLRSGELVIEYQGSEHYVGELALLQAKDAHTGYGDTNRYSSTRALLLLLTTSAEMLNLPEYELQVVTGLPVETYSKENRKAVKQALEGEHIFFLNGRRHKAVIHVAKVIMEGAGALIAYGNPQSPLQGVIDIGGRTTDLFVARGQEPIAEMCKGKPIGVETIGIYLNTKINAHFGRELSASEIRTCLRASLGQGQYQPINADGKLVEATLLQEWTEQTVKEVAEKVVGFVAGTWNSSEKGRVASNIAPVALVGGGAYYFHSVIRKRVEHAIMPLKPERANAEGYAALANVLAAQNRITA